jgi:hypothetical protein
MSGFAGIASPSRNFTMLRSDSTASSVVMRMLARLCASDADT